MTSRLVAWAVWAVMVGACGGRATADGAHPGSGAAAGVVGAGGSSSAGASGSGGASSSAGASGSGGVAAAGAGGGAPCVPQPEDKAIGVGAACEDLAVLAVENPVLVDDDGDGAVSPGEGFTLVVELREVTGKGFYAYPGVRFESDQPGVSVQSENWYYAIFACGSHSTPVTGHVDASVKPGTVVTLTARAAMLGEDCPEAPAVEIPFTVQ